MTALKHGFFAILIALSPFLSFAADALKESYKITPIPGPENAALEVGGMDYMPDGRLMVCTRRGEVWSLSGSQWKLFATDSDAGQLREVTVKQTPALPTSERPGSIISFLSP